MLTRFGIRAIAVAAALAWGVPAAQAQITVTLVPGNFTYQFVSPTTGLPITSLNMTAPGQSAKVSVYLLQTGGTPANLLQQLGAEGMGVRLNYSGTVATVPSTSAANIIARPPTSAEVGTDLSDFTLVSRYGSGTGTVTTTSAAISNGLQNANDPLPFPGDSGEDPIPANNALRMLIGTFNFTSTAFGSETVTAVSGPSSGVNNITGPNPVITGANNVGGSGPLPGNGAQGEIRLDQYLAQNVNVNLEPTLTINVVPVPEPGTLALGGLAAIGLAAWRRRRTPVAIAA